MKAKVWISYSVGDREVKEAIIRRLFETADVEIESRFGLDSERDPHAGVAREIRSNDIVVALLANAKSGVYSDLASAIAVGKPVVVLVPRHMEHSPMLDGLRVVVASGDAHRDAGEVAASVAVIATGMAEASADASAEALLQEAVSSDSRMDALSEVALEKLVMQLFAERGYAVRNMAEGPDVGFDFAVSQPGIADRPIAVQVKKSRPDRPLSVDAVRQAIKGLGLAGAVGGMIITSSGATAAAAALAAGTSLVVRTLQEILNAKAKDDLPKTQ